MLNLPTTTPSEEPARAVIAVRRVVARYGRVKRLAHRYIYSRGGTCVYCGWESSNGEGDHVPPLCNLKPGESGVVVPCCGSCNWKLGTSRAKTLRARRNVIRRHGGDIPRAFEEKYPTWEHVAAIIHPETERDGAAKAIRDARYVAQVAINRVRKPHKERRRIEAIRRRAIEQRQEAVRRAGREEPRAPTPIEKQLRPRSFRTFNVADVQTDRLKPAGPWRKRKKDQPPD